MKRTLILIAITVVGLIFSFLDAFYALLLYSFYAFASPLKLAFGFMQGLQISFLLGILLIVITIYYHRKLFLNVPITYLTFAYLFACVLSLAVRMNMDLRTIRAQVDVVSKLAIIAIVSPVILDRISRVRQFLYVVAGCISLLAAYYGLFGFLNGASNISGTEGLGQNNEYAAIVLGALPYLFFSITRMKNGWLRLAGAGIFCLNLLAIALALSRGVFVATAVIVPLLVLRLKRKVLLYSLLAASLPILGVAVYTLHFDNSNQRVQYEVSKQDRLWRSINAFFSEVETMDEASDAIPSAVSRLHFWRVALVMFKEHPWTGIGFAQYEKLFDTYDFSGGKYGTGRAVHNTALVILSETGVIGTITFAMLFGSCVFALLRAKVLAQKCSDEVFTEEVVTCASMVMMSALGIAISGCFSTVIRTELLWLIPTLSISLERIAYFRFLDDEKKREQENGRTAVGPRRLLTQNPQVDDGLRTAAV